VGNGSSLFQDIIQTLEGTEENNKKFSFRISVMRNETRTQDLLIKEQDCATLKSNFHCVRRDAEESNWFPVGVRMGYLRMRVGCICGLYITTFCTLVLLGYLLGLKSS